MHQDDRSAGGDAAGARAANPDREFLGSEFVLWLWYECERSGGEFELEGLGRVGVAFDALLELSAPERGSRVSLRGDLPTRLPEASAAIRAEKVPTLARLVVAVDEDTLEFTLDTATFDLRSVKAVSLAGVDAAEHARERDEESARTLLVFSAVVDELFQRFLAVRLDPRFRTVELPAIQDWIRLRGRGRAARPARGASA